MQEEGKEGDGKDGGEPCGDRRISARAAGENLGVKGRKGIEGGGEGVRACWWLACERCTLRRVERWSERASEACGKSLPLG